MSNDDEAILIFVEESEEHLADIESDLLAIEKGGSEIDDDRVNKVFRAVHTIKGGAGFLGYESIKTLAHKMENVMGMIRDHSLEPSSGTISVLLGAADSLQGMINHLDTSNETNITDHIQALSSIIDTDVSQQEESQTKTIVQPSQPISASPASLVPKIAQDPEAVQIFVEQAEEFLADMENDLLAIEKGGSEIDDALVNKVFRAVHTIKGGAAFLGYLSIKTLSHKMEDIMGMIRKVELEPTSAIISVLLSAADSLQSLLQNLENSGGIDISKHVEAMAAIVDREPDASVLAPPPSKPKPAPIKNKKKTVTTTIEKKSVDSSLRVSIRLLDKLMNLAGEMVLSRNQLSQAVSSKNMASIELVSQRINTITSELQESIMVTRMQPIANVFNRFPRLVRELSMDLGKEVELLVEGEDVELDKTIIEAINAPLTHLIRNSIDHGIEMPKDRGLANKDTKGTIILRARHEAGLVVLEVIDDGHGMSPDKISASVTQKGILSEEQIQHLSDNEKLNLIFLPGFSTTESVSDISGRGVGMDVVKTNLDKLGGQVDISSRLGKGTTIQIKLPLTLAIISAQVVICRNERYSIPQVNLEELIRVPAHEVKDMVEVIGTASVLKLRGDLLPLLRLVDVLGGVPEYADPLSGDINIERRKSIADRRSLKTEFRKKEISVTDELQTGVDKTRKNFDRRFRKTSTLNIAIVNTGTLKYGLIVHALKDAEEIVVKPLGKHLKLTKKYSGATIMGDGRVSLILDIGNIAREAKLVSYENSDRALQLNAELENSARDLQELQSFLLFRNSGTEQFGVPLSLVLRVIKIDSSEIENSGGKRVMQYGGMTLPLLSIDEVTSVEPIREEGSLLVIIFSVSGREIGLLASKPINAAEIELAVDDKTYQEPGLMGSMIIDKQITLLINIYEVAKILNPHWFSHLSDLSEIKGKYTILIAEDSTFFQSQISKTLDDVGFNVIVADDGVSAWEKLTCNAEKISLLVTDIEMPHLNGFELTKKIREDVRFVNLPIIALTTLTGEEDFQRGKRAGVNEYLIKFDRDLLLEKVQTLLGI